MPYYGFGCTGQQFEELLLILGLNGEDVDQRDKLAAQRDRCHWQVGRGLVDDRQWVTHGLAAGSITGENFRPAGCS
jgi:hypothetical protein